TPPVQNQTRQHVHWFVEQGLRPSAVMVRRKCFDTHQFDTTRKIAEDFHLWVRLTRDFQACIADTPVLYFRIRTDTLSLAARAPANYRDAARVDKLTIAHATAARYPAASPYLVRVVARDWLHLGRVKLVACTTPPSPHAAGQSPATAPPPRTVALLGALCLP